MNVQLVIAAAAGAYLFRSQIGSALGISTAAAPSAIPTTPTTTDPTAAATKAAADAAAAGATAAIQALKAQQAATEAAAKALADAQAKADATLIKPTIQVDNPAIHNALQADSTADSAATLARAQNAYGIKDSDYLLTVSQWNWYRDAAGLNGVGNITSSTEVGDNAIPASRYLQLRIDRGLIPVNLSGIRSWQSWR
jgi:hypothetical protein